MTTVHCPNPESSHCGAFGVFRFCSRWLDVLRRRLWRAVFMPPHGSMDPRLRVCPTCGHCDSYLTGAQIDAMLDDALKRVESKRPLFHRRFVTKERIDAAREEVLKMDFSE